MPLEPLTIYNTKLEFRDWGSIRADLSFIYEGRVSSAFQDCRSRSDFLGAWLVLKGFAEFKADGGDVVRADEGQWLVLRKAEGRQTFSKEARILSIRFQAEWPDGKPFFDDGLSCVINAADFPALEKKGRRLLKVKQKIAPRIQEDLRFHPASLPEFIEIKTSFFEWFSELAQTLAGVDVHPTRTALKDERIVKVLHDLDRLPLCEHLREDILASSVGLQVGQFVRVFRREVGTTPKRYFDERRRDACRRLLANTDTPIKEIALNFGYLRLSDFSAWFSSHEHVSPREYRRLYRMEGDENKVV